MRAQIAEHPRRHYDRKAFVDSDGVVDEPLTIALADRRRRGDDADLRL